MKAQVWKNEALGAEWEYKDIPEELREISQKYRTELVADQVKFLSPPDSQSQQNFASESGEQAEDTISPPPEIDPDDLPF